jgi:hypothetical protein
MDERFKLHQLRSTRFAMLVTILALAVIFYYELIAVKSVRWDIFTVLSIAAVAKISALIYYKIIN